jgi:outer membrane autotransporter protein
VVSIAGGTENDEIKLTGGNVTSTGSAVAGGDGDDLLELNGSTVAGLILGEGGADRIDWSSGSLLSIDGGDGSDEVTVGAAGFDGSQLLDGGDDVSTADGFFDTLTISGRNFSTSGDSLINWEKLVLDNSSMTLIGGNFLVGDASDSASGLFLINGAHFSAGTSAAIASASLFSTSQVPLSSLFVSSGSVFEGGGGGINAVSGKVTNFGTIDLQDGLAGDAFSVGGDYVGGGQILLDVNTAETLADRMEIGGNVVGGPTRIMISETSGLEGSGLPITVVTVAGQTRAGDFTSDTFTAGAYSYALELEGQDWTLRPTITAGGSFYPTVGVLLSGFSRESIGSYYRRNGSWSQARATGDEQVFAAASVLGEPETSLQGDADFWLRGIGAWIEGEGMLAGGAGDAVSYDRDSRGLQGGVDFVIAETADQLLVAGLFVQYGRISGSARDVASGTSSGSADTTAMGLGGTLSFSAATGYGEIAAGWNDFGIDTVLSDGAYGTTDGQGYAVSIEGGRIVQLSRALTLVPQAQLAWLGNRIDSFEASDGTEVEYDAEHAAEGRIGLGLEAAGGMLAGQPLALTGILNLRQQFGDPALTFISGQPLSLEQSGGSIEAGLGLFWGRDGSPFELYGEGSYREAIRGEGESGWNATGGFRLAF